MKNFTFISLWISIVLFHFVSFGQKTRKNEIILNVERPAEINLNSK
jgi:hypothetical protein